MRHTWEPAKVKDNPEMPRTQGAVFTEPYNKDCQARNKLLVAEANDNVDQVVNPSLVLFFRIEM